jgi:hypothetical protein
LILPWESGGGGDGDVAALDVGNHALCELRGDAVLEDAHPYYRSNRNRVDGPDPKQLVHGDHAPQHPGRRTVQADVTPADDQLGHRLRGSGIVGLENSLPSHIGAEINPAQNVVTAHEPDPAIATLAEETKCAVLVDLAVDDRNARA